MEIKKIKKTFSITLIFLVLANNSMAFFGASVSSGDVSMAANTLEQRYGFDSNIFRRGSQSQNGVKVSVNFDNPTPLEGDEVTAIALAQGYENQVEKLYFTWFLIRAEDDLKDENTIEKAKRRAAKIVAQGKFNPVYFATDYSVNKNVDADKDYFRTPFGGGNGVGGKSCDEEECSGIGSYEEESYLDAAKRVVDSTKITRCYRHNYGFSFDEEENDENKGNSGKDLVIKCEHEFPKPDKNGAEAVFGCNDEYVLGTGTPENGFSAEKEACWSLDPNNSDTDGDGVLDEADLVGMGQDKFKWKYKEGDRVGVVVEGTTSVVINEEGAAEEWEEMTVDERKAECDEEKVKCDDECQKKVGVEPDKTTGKIDPTTGEVTIQTESGEDPFATQDYQICKEECIKAQEKCIEEAQAYVDYTNQQRQIEAESKSLNGYKKIMWTGIDICTEDKINLMANDKCDSENDIGFSFLASKPVKEKAGENLETKINVFPESPQINTLDETSSDYVTLTAEITNEIADSNFAYYKWDIYVCGEGGVESCLNDDNLITSSCGEGSSLGECALIDKDGDGIPETQVLNSSSSAEGMGVSEIVFQPKADILSGEKSYLKVLTKTKRDKNNEQYSVTETDIPFYKNNTGIKFYKISQDENGNFGFNETKDEICNKKETGVNDGYSVMCPVFPYQVVALKSFIKEGLNGENFTSNWQVDGQTLKPINNCPFTNGCRDIAYFVVVGDTLEKKVVTLNSKEESLNNSTSQKMYSINNPIGLIKLDTEDKNAAWPVTQGNGQSSEDVFEAVAGKEVSFRVDLIPNYLNLNGEKDVDIIWNLNGDEINNEYKERYPDSGVSLEEDGKKISFPIPENIGRKINLSVSVRKSFFDEEEDTDEVRFKKEKERSLLEKTFGILNYQDSESEKVIEIRVVDEPVTAQRKDSIGLFFASTIKNAPEYLIFSVRLAIMLVLGWGLLFGFSYFSDFKKQKVG